MHHILNALVTYQFTPWKLVGLIGVLVFGSRWLVQLYATHKSKRVVMPLAFWLLSVCGSVLLLAYFIFGKNDSVGILSNLFPAFVALYNLTMHLRHRRDAATGDAAA